MENGNHNVIRMTRTLEERERELFERHWRARAAAEPSWAAHQIGGLLDRALKAEDEVSRLIAVVVEFADHDADCKPDACSCGLTAAMEGLRNE